MCVVYSRKIIFQAPPRTQSHFIKDSKCFVIKYLCDMCDKTKRGISS